MYLTDLIYRVSKLLTSAKSGEWKRVVCLSCKISETGELTQLLAICDDFLGNFVQFLCMIISCISDIISISHPQAPPIVNSLDLCSNKTVIIVKS